jgi:uncharacterized RDD family membrane protein YckC
MTNPHERPRFVRLIAFALDWVVIAAWGGLLFGGVMLVSNGSPQPFSGPWMSQAAGFVSMTLPVTLYFSVMESSRFGASVGKLLTGLRVRALHGRQLSFPRALARTVLKFVPWELGHLVAQQAVFSGEGGFPAWVYVPMLLSFLLPLWWVGSIVARGHAPYDHWAGARVEKSTA